MSTLVDTPTRTFIAAAAIARWLRVKDNGSGKLEVTGATDEFALGHIINAALAADEPIAVRLPTATGTTKMVAHAAISAFDLVYAAAAGRVDASGSVLLGRAMNAATAQDDVIEVLPGTGIGNITAVNDYPIPLETLKTWDAREKPLPVTAANDDFGITTGTAGTNAPTIVGRDSQSASLTAIAGISIPVPADYIDGEAIMVRVNAQMVTTISDDTALLDLNAYRQAAPTVDINSIAATSMNSLTAADIDFVLTPTNVVAGDLIDLILTAAVVDGSGSAAVIAKVNTITLRATTRA